MHKRQSYITKLMVGIVMLASTLSATAGDFFCKGPAPKFIEVEVHAMAGSSKMIQNYASCFEEIHDLNNAVGTAWGFGAALEFGLRDYLALGTQINLLTFNSRQNMIVANQAATASSTVFLSNRSHYLNFPVYLSFRFHPASNILWNVDFGAYYSYGLGGHQRQIFSNTVVNELGDLVSDISVNKPSFFNDNRTFINRFDRGDGGIYLATGLNFARHYHLGVRSTIGCKNISQTDGIKNPNIHNITLLFVVGYRF